MTTHEFQKKILKGYSKVHELKLITIGLASPEKIQSWAEKELPNGKIFGEVTNPNTFHYKTFKPSKGGLFCERIFGPIKDFECACGKRQKPNFQESQKILQHQHTTRHFCPICDVEYTWSIIRRYQLGYIKLHTPITHLWYFKSNPSYLSILFDMKKKDLEAIIYCTHGITLENIWKVNTQEATFSRSPTDLYRTWKKFLNFEEKMKKYQWIYQTDRNSQKREKESFRNQINTSLCDGMKKNNKKIQIWSDFFIQNFENKDKQKTFFSRLQAENNILNFTFLPTFETLQSFQNFSNKNNLCITNKKFFFLLQRQKNKKNFPKIFEKFLKKYVKQSFENSTAILFSTNFSAFEIQTTFFDIFLFTQETTRFQKSFFSSTPTFHFKQKSFSLKYEQLLEKTIFWIFLFQQFQVQKEKKVSKLKKLSRKQLLFLINIIPIFQSLEMGFQQKFLKPILFKLFSSFSNSVFFSLPLKLAFNGFEKKKTRTKSKKIEKVTFFQKNFFEELKQPNEIVYELQKKNSEPFSNFFFNFEELIQFFYFFQKIQYFQNFQYQNLNFFETVLTQYFFLFFFGETFSSQIQKNAEEQTKRLFSSDNSYKTENTFLLFENLFSQEFEKKKNSTVESFQKNFLNKQIRRIENKKIQNSSTGFRKKIRRKMFQRFEKWKIQIFESNALFISVGSVLKKVENFVKNPVLTMSYKYSWENDSEWKYFLYYQSFFFSDFQDMPIFSYQIIFPTFESSKLLFSGSSGEFGATEMAFSQFGNWSRETKGFFGGAGILEKFLNDYHFDEIKKMIRQHQILIPKLNQIIQVLKQTAQTKKDRSKLQKYFQKREHIIRRLKLLRKFFRNHSNPHFLILKNLPVLPPDLRPILKLENQIAASDLNRFYQRILYRNERIKKFSKDSATNQSFEMKYAQRLLQEAVDNLIQNGKGAGKPETNSRGQPLKSLSEILKGKQGRFRQYLLGKRVDYSGRSVIVVGPKLKLYECGIPYEMALELFLPFLIQKILNLKFAQTVIGAKNLLKNDSTLALHFLQKVMKNIPVLLNRAPTLHKLGFQAFLPKLVEGRAILLHPMVCPGFNADFDGDQMAVHIPLTVEARTEAWKFMLSFNNLINSATGEPNLLPSQDMVLGSYYLTLDYFTKFSSFYIRDLEKNKRGFKNPSLLSEKKHFLLFENLQKVLTSYQKQELSLHTPVWVKVSFQVNFGNDFLKPCEFRIKKNGTIQKISGRSIVTFQSDNIIFSRFIRTTVGRVLMNLMMQDCMYS